MYMQTTEIASVLEETFWGRGAGVRAGCRQVHTCHRSSGAAARPTVLASLDAPARTMNLPCPHYTTGCQVHDSPYFLRQLGQGKARTTKRTARGKI